MLQDQYLDRDPTRGKSGMGLIRAGSQSLVLCVLALLISHCESRSGSWQAIPIHPEDPIHDIFFTDDTFGWVYTYGTGRIFRTTDGGRRWKMQAELDSVYFEQIQFVDRSCGWICGEQGLVYRTTNGGGKWINISPGHRPVHMNRAEVPVPNWKHTLYYAMFFFDRASGLVAGGAAGSEGSGFEPLLLYTRDGGDSWILPPEQPETFIFNFFFTGSHEGFASGRGMILRTVDRGLTWEPVYSDSTRSGSQIRGLCFPDPMTGFTADFSGRILRTFDGGRSWSSGQITRNRLRSITFTDRMTGFAVGDADVEPGVLYETADSGQSWDRVGLDLPDLHRIRLSPGWIWAVGKEGTILKRRIERSQSLVPSVIRSL